MIFLREMASAVLTRLSFGLVQTKRSGDVLERFDELAAFMRARGLVDLTGRAVTSYKELAASVRDGSSDVAWLPPVVYAWLAEAVTPIGSIVREGETAYSCALVVREDSSIRSVDGLERVRAGWVDPWSAAGYVVPRLELARRGILPERAFASESFHDGHREALAALARGDCDVAGVYQGAWSGMEDVRVRVLATFGPIPTDVIAVRRNLAPRDYERVREAFRAASSDDEGRALLRAVFGGEELREDLAEGHVALRLAYESGVAQGLFD